MLSILQKKVLWWCMLLSASPGLITDLAIIVLLFVFAVIGCHKGFVKSFISTFGSFLSIIIAVLLCSTVATFLESKFSLITTISDSVFGLLSKIFGEEVMQLTLNQADNVTLGETNLTAWIIKIIIDLKGTGELPLDIPLGQIISPIFGYYITCVISVLGLFILLKIVFFIIGEIVKKLHKIKLIGAVDKLLGLVFGFFKGIITIQLLMMIIRIIPISFFQQAVVFLGESSIVSLIESINIFSYILSALSSINITEIIKTILIK